MDVDRGSRRQCRIQDLGKLLACRRQSERSSSSFRVCAARRFLAQSVLRGAGGATRPVLLRASGLLRGREFPKRRVEIRLKYARGTFFRGAKLHGALWARSRAWRTGNSARVSLVCRPRGAAVGIEASGGHSISSCPLGGRSGLTAATLRRKGLRANHRGHPRGDPAGRRTRKGANDA
jgi:hypothetical protein